MAEVERKTSAANTTQSTSAAGVPGDSPPETNVLHKYRSVTYLFTLAALTSNQVSDPKTFNGGQQLQYVILKSGGKGSAVMGQRTPSKPAATEQEKADAAKAASPDNPKPLNDTDANALVGEFNQKSPGRFDMFIDNVAIETIMGKDK